MKKVRDYAVPKGRKSTQCFLKITGIIQVSPSWPQRGAVKGTFLIRGSGLPTRPDGKTFTIQVPQNKPGDHPSCRDEAPSDELRLSRAGSRPSFPECPEPEARRTMELFLTVALTDMAAYPGRRLGQWVAYWHGALEYRHESDLSICSTR